MEDYDVRLAPGLKKGDLCAFSGYLGKLYTGIFWGTGRGTFQFVGLSKIRLEMVQAGKKPYVDYIGGQNLSGRVVKIDPSVLPVDELEVYNEMKKYTCNSK